jgi:hypothetical protein
LYSVTTFHLLPFHALLFHSASSGSCVFFYLWGLPGVIPGEFHLYHLPVLTAMCHLQEVFFHCRRDFRSCVLTFFLSLPFQIVSLSVSLSLSLSLSLSPTSWLFRILETCYQL